MSTKDEAKRKSEERFKQVGSSSADVRARGKKIIERKILEEYLKGRRHFSVADINRLAEEATEEIMATPGLEEEFYCGCSCDCIAKVARQHALCRSCQTSNHTY